MLQSQNLATLWAGALAISAPEMTSVATSSRLEIDLMLESLKCDYSITAQPTCEKSTAFESSSNAL